MPKTLDGDTSLHLVSAELDIKLDGIVSLILLPLNIPIGESNFTNISVILDGDGSTTLTDSIFKSYFYKLVKYSYYLN